MQPSSRRSVASALLVLLPLLAAALTSRPTTAQSQDSPLPVVATFSILGDFVQAVGGDRIALRTLVGPDRDAHTFEPTPSDGAALTDAAVVFENGLGFEVWLDDLYAASGSDAPRVVVTEPITPLPITSEPDAAVAAAAGSPVSGEPAEGATAVAGEIDPHVWQDVGNAIRIVDAIRDGLAAVDPQGAATYAANADAYLAELRALDAAIVARIETLPAADRRLVTSHDALGYFAARYGFTIVGTALGSVSTEAADPSAGEIAALVEEIRAAGVPAIFAENIHSPELMERIAAEAAVELAPTLYTDALGGPGSDGADYVGMMTYNAGTIVDALSD